MAHRLDPDPPRYRVGHPVLDRAEPQRVAPGQDLVSAGRLAPGRAGVGADGRAGAVHERGHLAASPLKHGGRVDYDDTTTMHRVVASRAGPPEYPPPTFPGRAPRSADHL